jgi:hypothetical protein
MIHFLNTVVEPALWFLGDWSLRWVVLISMLALGLAVLRPRRTAIRYLACCMVLISGMLLPLAPRWGPGWPSPRSDETFPAGQLETAPPISDPPVVETTQPAHQVEALPVQQGQVNQRISSPLPVSEAPVSPAELWQTRHTVVLCLGLLWVGGALGMVLRWIVGWLYLQQMRRGALMLRDADAELLQTCRAELG